MVTSMFQVCPASEESNASLFLVMTGVFLFYMTIDIVLASITIFQLPQTRGYTAVRTTK